MRAKIIFILSLLFAPCLIQWNINGLKTRMNNGELQRLIKDQDPAVICLQHINEPIDKLGKYHNVTITQPNPNEMGTCILVHEKVSHEVLQITTDELQVTGIKLILSQTLQILIYNLYNQPKCNYNLNNIKNLFNANPCNTLILGDFNAHSMLWNSTCTKVDRNGKIVENLIDELDLCILNDPESETYFSHTHNTFSAIDLSLCTLDIVEKCEWSIKEDYYTSDHAPIIIDFLTPEPIKLNPKYKTDKADWPKYKMLTNAMPPINFNQPIDDINDNFVKFIKDAANKSIPIS